MYRRTRFDSNKATNPTSLPQLYFVLGEELPVALQGVTTPAKLALLGFEGKVGQVLFLAEAQTLLLGGQIPASFNDTDRAHGLDFFALGALAANTLSSFRLRQICVPSLPAGWTRERGSRLETDLTDFLLGWLQGGVQNKAYKAKDSNPAPEITLSLSSALHQQLSSRTSSRLDALDAGLTLTRELVDLTPAELHPGSVPTYLDAVFGDTSRVSLEYLDAARLEDLGAGGILAVGRASRYPSVLSKVTLDPTGTVERTVCLVGKGVTYDSGGLDIKTGGHMHTMKCDMAGAATMAGVVRVLTDLELQRTRVVWFTGWVENMVSGAAYKADDILTTLSGQTVEVWNTDAEGRLTLADALSLATLEDPDYIVDAATLTGACVLALSEHYTALMGNSQALLQDLEAAFVENHERVQTLPLPEVLREQIQGELGDLRNTGKERMAGHLTAGLFLSHFVEQAKFRPSVQDKFSVGTPKAYAWAHLDIAGSSFNSGKNPLGVNGATGATVRSLVGWLEQVDTPKSS